MPESPFPALFYRTLDRVRDRVFPQLGKGSQGDVYLRVRDVVNDSSQRSEPHELAGEIAADITYGH